MNKPVWSLNFSYEGLIPKSLERENRKLLDFSPFNISKRLKQYSLDRVNSEGKESFNSL